MDVVEKLYRMGGVASRAALIACSSRRAVDRALRRGDIARDGRGRYALPHARESLRRASTLSAVVSHRSAATYWGWEQKDSPDKTDVTVPRRRNPEAGRLSEVTMHWADLTDEDVAEDPVTSKQRTLVDCLRSRPFDEALGIADSAARHGDTSPGELEELTSTLTGPGAARARKVARHVDGRAANPFESTLRAIAIGVRGLRFQPQFPVTLPGTGQGFVDLADPELRIVAEADSFSWHGSRAALWRDCRRYNRLALQGWLVLRFSWEDVMFHADYVRACLVQARELVDRRAQRPQKARKAA